MAASKVKNDTIGRDDCLDDPEAVKTLFDTDPGALLAAGRSMTPPAREQAACHVINHLRYARISLRAEHAPVLADLITELPLREQVEAWALILGGGDRLPAEVGHAIDRCVSAYFARMVEDHKVPFCDEAIQLVRDVPACKRWAALLRVAPTGQQGSIENALKAFSAEDYSVASLVAFDVLAFKGPRSPEGLSVLCRLSAVGGVTPPVRALRYIRAGFRFALHRQRHSVLIWAFDQVLQSGDFQSPLPDRLADGLWTLLTNERKGTCADALQTEAGTALDWLAGAAPEQFRVLMGTARGIYGKASVRWLAKITRAVNTQQTPGAAGSLTIPENHADQYPNGGNHIYRGNHEGYSYGNGADRPGADVHGSVRRVRGKAREPFWS